MMEEKDEDMEQELICKKNKISMSKGVAPLGGVWHGKGLVRGAWHRERPRPIKKGVWHRSAWTEIWAWHRSAGAEIWAIRAKYSLHKLLQCRNELRISTRSLKKMKMLFMLSFKTS